MDGAFRVAEWLVEPQLHTIASANTTTHLEPKAMKVLVYLAEHNHEVVSKERLIRAVWPDTFVTDAVLTRVISELRRAFGDDPREPRFILTVPKGGYRFVAPLSPEAANEVAVRSSHQTNQRTAVLSGVTVAVRSPRRLAVASGALVLSLAWAVYWMSGPLSPPRITRSQQLTYSGQVARVEFHREVFPALVSDGPRIYFTQIGTNGGLRFVPLTGGDVGAIPVPPGVGRTIDDISPDGTRLLIRNFLDIGAESALWVLPTAGGAARRVGKVTAHAAAWARDGDTIFYAYGNELFTAKDDGSHARKLLTLPARAFWIRVSPSGSVLRFTLRDSRTTALSLWEANADGTNLHELLPGWSSPPAECCGSWTPDGKYFLFESDRGRVGSIWALRDQSPMLRRATRGPTQLTTGPFHFSMPAATRDGKKLLAVGEQARGEALKYDARSREWLPFLPGIVTGSVRFSRDGNWATELDPHGVLWRMRADGTARLQLTSPPMSPSGFLDWSPDGTRIAFSARLPGKPLKIYVVSREGGLPEQLVSDERNETDPDWSPDGSSVIFGRLPDYMGEAFVEKAIHIVDLQTRSVSTLPDSKGRFSPHWSPDGRYVAAQPMKQDSLLLFDFVTGKWTELAKRHGHNPTWSADSRYVYAQDGVTIWRVRLTDRKTEDIASSSELRRAFTGFWFTGLAPDGFPMVGIAHSTTDIYAFDWDAP